VAEIVKEARQYAASRRSCGEITTAQIIEGLCTWIDIQQSSIRAQKQEMAEMRKAIPEGKIVRLVGGKNHTKVAWGDE
jgi:tRNA splicing ligase